MADSQSLGLRGLEFLRYLRYSLTLWQGKILAGVELCEIIAIAKNETSFFLKKKRWYAPILIWAGNWHLEQQGSWAKVLVGQEWYSWEQEIYARAYGKIVSLDSQGRIQIPAVAGVSLSAFLNSSEYLQSSKFKALIAATQALKYMHKLQVRWSDGIERLFSHGDATAENVIYNPTEDKAYWIDFDTVHLTEAPQIWRQADDLRALIYSAAFYADEVDLAELVGVIIKAYSEPVVLQQMWQIVDFWSDRPNSYHLAQAPMTYQNYRKIEQLIRVELGELAVTGLTH